MDAAEAGRVRVGALLGALYSAEIFFQHVTQQITASPKAAQDVDHEALGHAAAAILLAAFNPVPHVRSGAANAAGALAKLVALLPAEAFDGAVAVTGAAAALTFALGQLSAMRATVVGDPKAVSTLLCVDFPSAGAETVDAASLAKRSKKRNKRSSKCGNEEGGADYAQRQRLADVCEICIAWAFAAGPRRTSPQTRAAVVHMLKRHHSDRKARLLLPQLQAAARQQAASLSTAATPAEVEAERAATQGLLGIFNEETAASVCAAPQPLPKEYVSALTSLLVATPDASAQDAAEDRLNWAQLRLLQRELRPPFFMALPQPGQQLVLAALCDLARQRHSAVLIAPLRACLGRLPLSAMLVAEEVARCLRRAYEQHGLNTDGSTRPAAKQAAQSDTTPRKRRKDASAAPVTSAVSDDESDTGTGEGGQAFDAARARAHAVAQALTHVTFLLEILLVKSLDTVADHSAVVAPLFQLLSLRQAVGSNAGEIVEHATQTLLAALARLIDAADKDEVDEDDMRAAVVVQCLRESDQPPTHNAALLLLASMARVAPSHVVAVLMPLFSFMGAHSVRRDDAYTFRVLDRTIEGVVPPALAAAEAQAKTGDSAKTTPLAVHETVVELCHIFVASFHTIPDHRRLQLFRHLAAVLAAPCHLHSLAALLLRHDVLKPLTRGAEQGGVSGDALAGEEGRAATLIPQFVLSLCLSATPEAHLSVLLSMVDMAQRLPVQRDANPAAWAKRVKLADGKPVALLFNPAEVTPRQLRHFKYLTVRQVSSHLNSSAFLKSMRATAADPVQAEAARQQSLRLSEALLTLCSVIREQADEAARRNAEEDRRVARLSQQQRRQGSKGASAAASTQAGHDAGSRRYWSQLQTDAFVALHRVNALLSPSDFAGVVRKLLQNADLSVKRRALEMLAQRVEHDPAGSSSLLEAKMEAEGLSRSQTDALLSLLPAVVTLMCQTTPLLTSGSRMPSAGGEALSILQQSAVHTYTILVTAFAARRPEPFEASISQVLTLLTNGSGTQGGADSFELAASVIAALGALAAALGPKFLVALAQFGPALNRQFRRALALPPSGESVGRHALLLQACLGALRCLVTRLPTFIGPYLADYLSALADPAFTHSATATKGGKDSGAKDVAGAGALPAALIQRAGALRRLVASSVPARLLLPQIFAAVTHAIGPRTNAGPNQGYTAAALINVLRAAVENAPRPDLAAHLREIFAFYRRAFDFRTHMALTAIDTLDAMDDEDEQKQQLAKDVAMMAKAALNQEEEIVEEVDGDDDEEAGGSESEGESESEEDDEDDEDEDDDDDVEDGMAHAEVKSAAENKHVTAMRTAKTSLPLLYRQPEVDAVEVSLVEAVVATAMRLSDTSFRPEFLLFLDWARQKTAHSRRLLSLFRLIAHLSKMLKQFFVPYFAHMLKLSLEVLEGEGTAHLGRDEKRVLHGHVLGALKCCFQYDEDEFMTKERFNGVFPVLVQQLERNVDEDADAYRARTTSHVQPCLVQLAVCAGDEARWKDLNTAVLEMTRHADPLVRCAALLVVQGFYDQLGEEFLGLLPESVLYLAELLEDNDQEVENTCQNVVATIEKHLGEPLSKFF